MKYFKLRIIFCLFLTFSLYHCNLSPNLNSNQRFYGILSFLYTNEFPSISNLLLSGILSDVNGLALGSATILVSNNIVQPKESVPKSIVTNSNGEFSFNLREGKFILKMSKSNNEYLGNLTILLKYPYYTPTIESQEGQFLVTNFKSSTISSGSLTSTPTIVTPIVNPTTDKPIVNPKAVTPIINPTTDIPIINPSSE